MIMRGGFMFRIKTNMIEERLSEIIPDVYGEVEESRNPVSVNTILDRENKIWLGYPQVYNLYKIAGEQNLKLVDLFKEKFAFFVHFSVSLLPHEKNTFEKCVVEMELSTTDVKNAYIHDIFPHEIFSPSTFTRSIGLNPNLEIDVEKIAQVKASAFEYKTSSEYSVYHPEIKSFGKGDRLCQWHLTQSPSKKLDGVKDFYVIVISNIPSLHAIIRVKECTILTGVGVLKLRKKIDLSSDVLIEKNVLLNFDLEN